MKKLICVIQLVILLTAALSCTAFADTGIGVEPGQDMPDFTVNLTDGTTATLSEVLKEKDLVVLNIFASWCNPCEKEFPDMEKVYQANKDRMEIISVSAEPNDTMEIISDYKESHSLSFSMGLAEDNLNFITLAGYPTTIFVNRDGKVGFVKSGAFVAEGDFEEKVSFFLDPDYNGGTIETEKAVNTTAYIIAVFIIGNLMLIIGRWGIFRKAGKKGWFSLIPILNTYTEYSTCWKGWIGLIPEFCNILVITAGVIGMPQIVTYVLLGVGLLIGIPESLKLAKTFGKGKVFGVLLFLPVFKNICRLILGVGKSEYRAPSV